MQKKLLPFSAVSPSLESLHSTNFRPTRVLYLTVLVSIIGAFAALPLIQVAVTRSSPGVLRTQLRNNTVTTITSGRVLRAELTENAAVTVGDTLLVIDAGELTEQTADLQQQIVTAQEYLTDLRTLERHLDRPAPENRTDPVLLSPLYHKQYLSYRQQEAEAELKIAFADKKLTRQQSLYLSGTIAEAEFNETEFEWDMAQQAGKLLHQNQRRLWEQDRLEYRRQIRDWQQQIDRLQLQQQHYVVTAPVTGYIGQTSALQPGNYVTAGQQLAAISADDCLLVEAYVSPADIGLLREGMNVAIQIDAFHRNQWGMVEGAVTNISQDVVEHQAQAYFAVQCSLAANYLTTRTGYRGHFKKGMTATAHFQLTRRSLFDLLYDKMDDWLNPAQAKNDAT